MFNYLYQLECLILNQFHQKNVSKVYNRFDIYLTKIDIANDKMFELGSLKAAASPRYLDICYLHWLLYLI